MRWNEIITEEGNLPNPFTQSKIKNVMYHGSNAGDITKFKRTANGIWFSDLPTWGKKIYGPTATIYSCYIDVRNPYYPSEDEVDEYYGEWDKFPAFFQQLEEQGYDAYVQGGESGSVAVLGDARIVDSITGQPM